MNDMVLFLCEHGAAKSVIAAAYFNRLAEQFGSSLRADSAATEPGAEIYPFVVQMLSEEGIDVAGEKPRQVTADDLAQARRVISMGCVVENIAPPGVAIDRWDDVPAVSENPATASELIRGRIEQLIQELENVT